MSEPIQSVTPSGVTSGEAHQYGVPMKDFLLASVAVICADTPKSAKEGEGGKWAKRSDVFWDLILIGTQGEALGTDMSGEGKVVVVRGLT